MTDSSLSFGHFLRERVSWPPRASPAFASLRVPFAARKGRITLTPGSSPGQVLLPSMERGLVGCFYVCYVAVVGLDWFVGDLGGASGVGYVGLD